MSEAPTEPAAAVGRAVARDVVRVAGPDAERYLQGQCSQDLGALAVATSTWTFVLQPQGKVDAWARITKTAADAFVLDVDGGAGPVLEARLRRFLLRTKADIEVLDWPAVAVRGDAPRDDLPDGVLRVPAPGPDAVVGYDLLGPGAALPDGVDEVDAEVLDALRIVHGVPAMGAEIDDTTIPAELGQWVIDACVSFTKGCYTGQELTARIDSRGGNVPRHLRVLRLDAPVPIGTDVVADDDVVGSVTSVARHDALGPVALALLGRRVEVGATVRVGEGAATVAVPPIG